MALARREPTDENRRTPATTPRTMRPAPPTARKRTEGKENENGREKDKDGREASRDGKGKEARDARPGRSDAESKAPRAKTPRRALSTVVSGQETPLAPLPAAPRRPIPKRALTNPLFVDAGAPKPKVSSSKTSRPALASTSVAPSAFASALKASASASASTSASTSKRRLKTPTASRQPSPHTPEDRIGINPLKRGAPTTYDRPTGGRKFRRIGETEEDEGPKKRRVVLDDEVEDCDPVTEPGFAPLSPPKSRKARALETAIEEEESEPQPAPRPGMQLSLPPIPAEGADDLGLELPELLDPEMLELDLGGLDLPDMDFLV